MRRRRMVWGALISAASITGVGAAVLVGLGSLSPLAWVVLVAALAVAVVLVMQEIQMRQGRDTAQRPGAAPAKAARPSAVPGVAPQPQSVTTMTSATPARAIPPVGVGPVMPTSAEEPSAALHPASLLEPVRSPRPEPASAHASPPPPEPPAASAIAAQPAPATTAMPPETASRTRASAPLDPAQPVGVAPEDALEALRTALSGHVRVMSCHLWLYDSATETARLVASTGEPAPPSDPLPATRSAPGKAAIGGKPVLERACVRARDGRDIAAWRLAVPLIAGDARGSVAIDVSGAEPDVPALARAVARTRTQLAGALALHVARDETGAVRTLVDAAGQLLKIVDSQELLTRALRTIRAMCDADTVSIMLLKPGSRLMTVRASLGLPESAVRGVVVGEGEGIAGWVLATGKPLIVEDVDDGGPTSRRHGVRSAMIVPIWDGDDIIGIMNAGSRGFSARFSEGRLSLLESFGRILATALNNATAVEATRDLYLDTVKALVLALERKDPYSHGTAERVYELATRLGEQVGMSREELRALRVAALLHDIGMAAAGEGVAASDRQLTTVEWGMLKMHPVIAAEAIEQAPALRDAVPIVYHHHEWFDGTGYVTGLAGQAIPFGARVLSVADAYVAMTSPRPYRAAKESADALGEVKDLAGTQFDPVVVEALGRVFETSGHAA